MSKKNISTWKKWSIKIKSNRRPTDTNYFQYTCKGNQSYFLFSIITLGSAFRVAFSLGTLGETYSMLEATCVELVTFQHGLLGAFSAISN